MKADFIFLKLNNNNFNLYSLKNFVRRQEVSRCWRRINDKYTLTPVHYIEDWDSNELHTITEKILNEINNGSLAYAAIFCGDIVGFALLENKLFGSRKQYVNLAEFYVSAPYRKMGIGKKLFSLICNAAVLLGAEKLYISAHSAEESIAAYKSYGCTFAEETNYYLAEKEPFDLQLEYSLNLRIYNVESK